MHTIAEGLKAYLLAALMLKILHFTHTVYLRVLYGSHNKQHSFPYMWAGIAQSV